MGVIDLTTGELRPPMDMERAAPETTVAPGDAGKCPGFNLWLDTYVTSKPVILQWFLSGALRNARRNRRLLVGAPGYEDELIAMCSVLAGTLGDYQALMPRSWWSDWPEERSYKVGRALLGTRVAFLAPLEWWMRFPQDTLCLLLSWSPVTFWTPMGWAHQLPPRYFILPGKGGRRGARGEPNPYLNRALVKLPAPVSGGHVSGPDMWLPEEAPHILAWMLHEPTREELQAAVEREAPNGS
jgi:hypothetical protein